MLDKFGKYLAIIIVVLIFVMGYLVYSQNKKINRLNGELSKVYNLANGNAIPDHVFSSIEILKNEITEIKRLGVDSVYTTTNYLPPETEVHYVTSMDSTAWNKLLDIQTQIAYLEANDDTTGLAELILEVEELKYSLFSTKVEYDKYGTTLMPVVGLGINNRINPEITIGARLLYYNRLGTGLNANIGFDSLEVSLGGFIDTRLPYFDNVGLFVGAGYNFMVKEVQYRMGLQGYLN